MVKNHLTHYWTHIPIPISEEDRAMGILILEYRAKKSSQSPQLCFELIAWTDKHTYRQTDPRAIPSHSEIEGDNISYCIYREPFSPSSYSSSASFPTVVWGSGPLCLPSRRQAARCCAYSPGNSQPSPPSTNIHLNILISATSSFFACDQVDVMAYSLLLYLQLCSTLITNWFFFFYSLLMYRHLTCVYTVLVSL